MSMFFRRGGRLDVVVLRKVHAALSVVARNTPSHTISEQSISAELQRLRTWWDAVEDLEAHVHVVSRVALEHAGGKMKPTMVHHEWNFFTKVREFLRVTSTATGNFGTFNAFAADTATITFATAKVDASSLGRPVRGVPAPAAVPKRTRSDMAAYYSQINYYDVADVGEKKAFAVIDLADTPPLASYYKWPALVDAGTGNVADPLTFLKWGDAAVDSVDVPVGPSMSHTAEAAEAADAHWGLP
jgi:hypothetical protein